MPTYCFRKSDGEIVERFMPISEVCSSVTLEDGSEAVRDYRAEHGSRKATAGWPMECYALGVHPSQSKELYDRLRMNGVPTEISRDGDPIITNANHYKKVQKVLGVHQRNSFC